MRIQTALLFLLLGSGLFAENLEKTQKKELETQVKKMTGEAQKLEKDGQLAEARIKYTESQALIEVKDVSDALKRLDDEIEKRVKEALGKSRKLYDAKNFKDSATTLEDALKLQAFEPILAYDLALCYYQLGERSSALEYLRQAQTGTADPKQKEKLAQMLTFFTTGENAPGMKDSDKDRVTRVNQLADSIGFEASLEDLSGLGESFFAEGTPAPPGQVATPASPAGKQGSTQDGHKASLCNGLDELKTNLASSPSVTFNRANCAESNVNTAEAVLLLERYLEISPSALDAGESRARIADLKSLLDLPGQSGVQVRRLYASAYSGLAERKYDRALTAFNKAGDVAPEFALTKWKLGLFYEATGDIDRARQNFTRYRELNSDPVARERADLHLATLDAKRAKYDAEIDLAGDIVADLLNRSLKLSFNGSESRSALRAERAQVKKKSDKSKAKSRVGGFAIPFPYAQQQLGRASEHLQIALALFPLGAEANELMGIVFLQANDGHSAAKSFDVVASQGLPVSFYAEMRGRKMDEAVKVELNRDGLHLISLAAYDKKGSATPPQKPAGEDGLGDMVMEPNAPPRQPFTSLDVTLSQIKRVETDKGVIKLRLSDQEVWLSPIYLPSFTPIEGPQARRFANNYTRLFVRYPGLEDSKLGNESLSGGEKFKMGYNIASNGFNIASSGFAIVGIASSVQSAISIARTIHSAVNSLSISFASWEKSVEDQQQLLVGREFKSIPTQAANLSFVQDTN
jgi:tetratricopeptide (TPR) repeat protein